jgi:hypothetical protein
MIGGAQNVPIKKLLWHKVGSLVSPNRVLSARLAQVRRATAGSPFVLMVTPN